MHQLQIAAIEEHGEICHFSELLAKGFIREHLRVEHSLAALRVHHALRVEPHNTGYLATRLQLNEGRKQDLITRLSDSPKALGASGKRIAKSLSRSSPNAHFGSDSRNNSSTFLNRSALLTLRSAVGGQCFRSGSRISHTISRSRFSNH